MLVGSIARPEDGWSVEDVFRHCANTVGQHVSMLPDGEIGDRYYWINYIARRTYATHPDLVTLSHHTVQDWKPKSYKDHWIFRVKPGVKEIRFPKIGYADEAKRSYEIFRRLRALGTIPNGTRFAVALPSVASATRPFVGNSEHFEMLSRGYEEAITREIRQLSDAVPHRDLAIQWDVCTEVAAIEGVEGYALFGIEPMQLYCETLGRVCRIIPDEVWLGLHICYGSLAQEPGTSSDTGHFCEIKDLNVSVDMANRGIHAISRSVEWLQMSVQLSNGFEESYYEPLRRLDVDARTYLGLIHLHDGLSGALRRITIARKYLPDFGISTQCGWGRRPIEQKVQDLLDLHRNIADRVNWH